MLDLWEIFYEASLCNIPRMVHSTHEQNSSIATPPLHATKIVSTWYLKESFTDSTTISRMHTLPIPSLNHTPMGPLVHVLHSFKTPDQLDRKNAEVSNCGRYLIVLIRYRGLDRLSCTVSSWCRYFFRKFLVEMRRKDVDLIPPFFHRDLIRTYNTRRNTSQQKLAWSARD